MTAAEYRVIRKACGLSACQAAAFHKVTESTVVLWEAALNDVPRGAADAIKRLDARLETAVLKSVDLYVTQLDLNSRPDEVWLVRYRTAESFASGAPAGVDFSFACHDALIRRTTLALKRIGADVKISWR